MKFFYAIRSAFDPTDIQNVTATTGKTVIYHNRLRPVEEICILEEKKLNLDEYYIEEKCIPENIMDEEALATENKHTLNYSEGEGDTSISISF